MQLPLGHFEDVDTAYLPPQYRHDERHMRGIGWLLYDWEKDLDDTRILAHYAHVLDVEIIDNVTWMQAIELVAGYRPDDDEDEWFV
ncbi:MAG: hypothetical protein ACKO83_10110 [Roseiflexaceae bacterium]